MVKEYKGIISLNFNLMAAVDVETTGRMPGYHEIIQVAVQPLNSDLEPVEGVHPFYMQVAPNYPERAEKQATQVHGIDIYQLKDNALSQEKAADMFDEWFQNLELPYRKSLIPLAHNWAFEAGFLKAWLGYEAFNQFFHPHPRDSMLLGIALNDRAYFQAEKAIFSSVGLKSMCQQLKIPHPNAHDALADALAEAKLYKALLQMPTVVY
jgi:DNA polymerase III epsilon subunit-like protein